MQHSTFRNILLTGAVILSCTAAGFGQNVQTFSYNGNNFQYYTVPASGWYFLDASGGQGGAASNSSHTGGLGARMQGYALLQAGDVLKIAVGGQGGTGTTATGSAGANIAGGGGGGGSSIVKVNGTTLLPLLIAGGGGGAAANYDGTSGLSGNNGDFTWGGTNGGGGGLGTNSNSFGGAGGAGYNGDGSSHCNGNCSGTAPNYTNLLSWGGQAYLSGDYGGCYTSNSLSCNKFGSGGCGGWGGGGQGGPATSCVGNNNDGGGGGGGGWSGGGGGKNQGDGGGGGGSYVDASLNTSNCIASSGVNSGNGTVSIEYLAYSNTQPVNQIFSFQGNTFQYFTAPATGYYQITALGASGGSVNGNSGGKGAQMQGYFLLHAGETVKIAAGGAGQDGQYGSNYQPTLWTGCGGGGASSVTLLSTSSPILFAGGGGGAAFDGAGQDASLSGSGTTPPTNGGVGGTNGNGGATGDNSGSGYSYSAGEGGAGYKTNGGSNGLGNGGQAYLSGNYGGSGVVGAVSGGWGGGGQGAAYKRITNSSCSGCLSNDYYYNGCGGGGGGYSGGGGGGNYDNSYGGGGGGSYSSANCGGSNISGANNGDGSVSISGPNVGIDTVNTPGPTYTWAANGVTYQHSGTYYHVDQANCIVRVLDLSIGNTGACQNYLRVDTTVISCGGYTNPLNGKTYTENTTDSIRVGCVKYIARIIVAPPAALIGNMIAGSTASAGAMAVCNNTSQTFAVRQVPYTASYQWYPDWTSGAMGTSTTNSINVQFGNNFSGGNICVTPVNACGAGATLCRAITVLNTPPTGRLQITGPAAPFISGNYSVAPISGATTYTWSVSNNQAVIVSGQGTPFIQLEAQPGFTHGNLSVRASNCRGNGSQGTLVLNTNGKQLGAVVAVTLGRPTIPSPAGLSVTAYPNPSHSAFSLQLTDAGSKPVWLKLTDLQGRMIRMLQVNPNETTVFGHELKAGVYMIEANNGNETKTVRVVKN